ncbi:hypothetical protein PG984_012906 [Apiospora sp. TS-2023a]
MSNDVAKLFLFAQSPDWDKAQYNYHRRFNFVAEFLFLEVGAQALERTTAQELASKVLQLAKGEDSLPQERSIPDHEVIKVPYCLDCFHGLDDPGTILIEALTIGIVYMNPTWPGIENLIHVLVALESMQEKPFMQGLESYLKVAQMEFEPYSSNRREVKDSKMHALCIKTCVSCIERDDSLDDSVLLQGLDRLSIQKRFRDPQAVLESNEPGMEELKPDALKFKEAMQKFELRQFHY